MEKYNKGSLSDVTLPHKSTVDKLLKEVYGFGDLYLNQFKHFVELKQ
jgi:hypothetical protein